MKRLKLEDIVKEKKKLLKKMHEASADYHNRKGKCHAGWRGTFPECEYLNELLILEKYLKEGFIKKKFNNAIRKTGLDILHES